MKTIIKALIIGLLITSSLAFTKTVDAQTNISVSFSVFHDNLRAYGTWTNHPKYGQVWMYKQTGFRPYSSAGHWVYTQYGWTWVSDYPWGWAPFHYGRWAYEPSFGWFWVPGYEWGPAWVSWSTGGDYYGWAPLAPGLSITVGIGSIPAERWIFMPRRYIGSPSPSRYYVPPAKNVTIIKNTTVINNTNVTRVSNRNITYVAGPKREDVERDTKSKVTLMNVNNSQKPGKVVIDNSKKTVNIYKPDINEKTINKTVNDKKVNDDPPNKQAPQKQGTNKPKPKPKDKPHDKK